MKKLIAYFGINPKDAISNIVALGLILGESVNQFITAANDNPISWGRLSLVLVIAFLGWINGKKNDLAKPPENV